MAVRGRVARFAEALDETTRTLPVEIDLPNPARELRPGMFANVSLSLEQKTDALRLPAQALVVEKAKASVFTLVHGKAKKVPVKLGFEDDQAVEILDGLAGNETVILTGKLVLADGQPVQVAEGK
jgi:membrane fusion protein (multidrug efflux system)